MAWVDEDLDEHGKVMGVRLIHCPCDGYEPPVGGRHVTPFDFPVEPYVEAGGEQASPSPDRTLEDSTVTVVGSRGIAPSCPTHRYMSGLCED
jgi:hypothetical protein